MKGAITMLPEERARIKIDKQLINAGFLQIGNGYVWEIFQQKYHLVILRQVELNLMSM